jgi:hypothetical protein
MTNTELDQIAHEFWCVLPKVKFLLRASSHLTLHFGKTTGKWVLTCVIHNKTWDFHDLPPVLLNAVIREALPVVTEEMGRLIEQREEAIEMGKTILEAFAIVNRESA